MEGKVVIVSVVLVSLLVVLGQIHQVDAQIRSCCPSQSARNLYNMCRISGSPQYICANAAGCRHYNGNCPAGWTYDMLQNTAPAAGNIAVNEYCKSGCVSSVCAAITTLQNSDATEVMNGAVGKCTDACTDFCTKKASIITTAVETV